MSPSNSSGSSPAQKKSTAKKSSAKKSSAKKSTAKKSAPKKSTGKKSTGTEGATNASSTSETPDAAFASAEDADEAADETADETASTNPFGLPFSLTGTAPDLTNLGDFIRSQRERAELSVRRLAELADVSNPYLSQVERGLRKPSADILQQVANALRISVESLYVRAGILPEIDREVSTIPEAIEHDPHLTDDQKRALRGVYDSFVAGS